MDTPFWRLHCRYLLGRADAPDPDLRADLLLAGLAAEQVRHWLHEEDLDPAELASALSSAALALACGGIGAQQPRRWRA